VKRCCRNNGAGGGGGGDGDGGDSGGGDVNDDDDVNVHDDDDDHGEEEEIIMHVVFDARLQRRRLFVARGDVLREYDTNTEMDSVLRTLQLQCASSPLLTNTILAMHAFDQVQTTVDDNSNTASTDILRLLCGDTEGIQEVALDDEELQVVAQWCVGSVDTLATLVDSTHRLLFYSGYSKSIVMLDLDSFETLHVFDDAHSDVVKHIHAFVPDLTRHSVVVLMSNAEDGSVVCIDCLSRRLLCRFEQSFSIASSCVTSANSEAFDMWMCPVDVVERWRIEASLDSSNSNADTRCLHSGLYDVNDALHGIDDDSEGNVLDMRVLRLPRNNNNNNNNNNDDDEDDDTRMLFVLRDNGSVDQMLLMADGTSVRHLSRVRNASPTPSVNDSSMMQVLLDPREAATIHVYVLHGEMISEIVFIV